MVLWKNIFNLSKYLMPIFYGGEKFYASNGKKKL
jgi:hypothetical protein